VPPQWLVRLALGVGLTGCNAIGIGVVYVLATLVVPMPDADRAHLREPASLAVAGLYVLVFGTIGTWHAWRVLHPVVEMLRPDGRTSEDDQREVLAAPRRLFAFQALLWAVASVLVGLQYLRWSWDLGLSMFFIVGLAGWTTSCLTYLLSERALRPVARRVLRRGFPSRRYVRSVANRTMFAWGLGTGAPVLGLVLTGALAFADPNEVAPHQLALTMVVLGGIILLVGGLATLVAAQASSEPIRGLRAALGRVERGELDVEVHIDDGTEIGMLQAGFNEMVHGLREREELRDLFGRHVGAEVARTALEGGVRLGGETREVVLLFVDVVGSTAVAEDLPPEEVVTLLNRFFDVVIEVVHDHDGWINKFAGDAALAVWGAPASPDGMHTAALRAARVLAGRLHREVPELPAGIGVSCGTAVAGNVGTAERYEYTVIGDPVNEAARLTDHAKDVDGRVVAHRALLEAADPDEAGRWVELEAVTVRGRSAPTPIARPAAS
jgi:adenylate cyclase